MLPCYGQYAARRPTLNINFTEHPPEPIYFPIRQNKIKNQPEIYRFPGYKGTQYVVQLEYPIK